MIFAIQKLISARLYTGSICKPEVHCAQEFFAAKYISFRPSVIASQVQYVDFDLVNKDLIIGHGFTYQCLNTSKQSETFS